MKNKLSYILGAGVCLFALSVPSLGQCTDWCYDMKPVFIGPYMSGTTSKTVIKVQRTNSAKACGNMSMTAQTAFYPGDVMADQALAVALTAVSLGKNITIAVANANSPSVLERVYLSD